MSQVTSKLEWELELLLPRPQSVRLPVIWVGPGSSRPEVWTRASELHRPGCYGNSKDVFWGQGPPVSLGLEGFSWDFPQSVSSILYT